MSKTEKTPMREEKFVTKHVNFMSGRLKIANVKNHQNLDSRDIIQKQKKILI